MKFTTTDNYFDQRIQNLFIKFLGKNNDISVINIDHCMAEYILGFYIMRNTPWSEVDEFSFQFMLLRKNIGYWIV